MILSFRFLTERNQLVKYIVLSLYTLTFQGTVFAQDAEVINHDMYISIENNTLKAEVQILLQINTRQGETYNNFTLHYSGKSKIKSLDITLETINGQLIRRIKKNEIKDLNLIRNTTLYSDDFVLVFEPRHNLYPYRIRVKYEQTYDEFFQIAKWYPVKHYRVPTHNAQLSLEVPIDFGIRFREKFVEQPSLKSDENSVKYTWKASYTKLLDKEDYSPGIYTMLPSVVIMPDKFTYGIDGKFTSWQDFGQWVWYLNQGLDELTQNEKTRISQLFAESDSNLDKIRKCYHYLQENTRYIDVSIDIGGFKPYPAEYVCNNKFGDCKALTNYMKAILKYAGIDSYYSLVYAGDPNEIFDTSFPSQYFNHAILQVPLGLDTIWLECTSKTLPFGYVHTGIQNRYALIIDNNNSKLARIRPWGMDESKSELNYEYQINISGSTEVKASMKLKGARFEEWNSVSKNYSEYDKERIAKEILYLPEHDLVEWRLDESDSSLASTRLYAHYSSHNTMQIYGRDFILNFPKSGLPEFVNPTKRYLPAQIDYALGSIEKYTFIIPIQNIKIILPEDITLISEIGTYTIKFTFLSNSISIERDFTLFPGFYAGDEYVALYNFIQQIRVLESKHNILIQNL